MDLDLVNNIVSNVKRNKVVTNLIKQLQNNLENNNINKEKEDIPLVNPTYEGNKIITKFRDKMYIERAKILNNYFKQTVDKGQMYYIYDKNPKITNGYKLCVCEEGKSNIVIEEEKRKLPDGVKIGSVLRKNSNEYVLDKVATEDIAQKIYNMKQKLLEEQTEFLESKRIEGHIYEMGENNGDRAWLFDVTNGNEQEAEGVEEIDFPKELLKDGKEGDLYIYKNGEYKKYLTT